MRIALLVLVVLATGALPVTADHEVVGLERQTGQDLIAAVTDPTFDDSGYVRDSDLVIGVSDAGTGAATAYPLSVLVWHEVVNDVVGDTPILVTFCPLCRTGIVFERPFLAGSPLTFRVSGYLYRNNLVMYDAETFSLWPQILGEAINGTMHGMRLRAITSAMETWLEWRTAHPDTRLLARPFPPVCFPDGTCLEGGLDYEDDPYDGYYATEGTFRPRIFPDDRLHPKALVLGLTVAGVSVAYPFDELARSGVLNDVVGGPSVVIAHHNGTSAAFRSGGRMFAFAGGRSMVDELGRAYDVLTGEGTSGNLERLEALVALWFAWKDHVPNTYVYGVDWPWGARSSTLGVLLLAASVPVVAVAFRPRRRDGSSRRPGR